MPPGFMISVLRLAEFLYIPIKEFDAMSYHSIRQPANVQVRELSKSEFAGITEMWTSLKGVFSLLKRIQPELRFIFQFYISGT